MSINGYLMAGRINYSSHIWSHSHRNPILETRYTKSLLHAVRLAHKT